MGKNESKQQCKPRGVVISNSDKKAIRDAWQAFCKSHPEPGPVPFSQLLDKHPGYQAVFKDFRDVPKDAIKEVHMFQTHSSAMGKFLNDVVAVLDTPTLLVDVVRTNALEHTTRNGVLPLHFESLWILIAARLSVDAQLTPAAASSWEKLLKAMQAITVEVYEHIGITSPQQEPMPTNSVSVQETMPGKQPNIEEAAVTSKPKASNLECKPSGKLKATKTKASKSVIQTAREMQQKPELKGHDEDHAKDTKESKTETTAPEGKSASDCKSSKSESDLPRKKEGE